MTLRRKIRGLIKHDSNGLVWLLLLLVGIVLGVGAMRLRQSLEPAPSAKIQTIYLSDPGLFAKPAAVPPPAVPAAETLAATNPARLDLVVIASQPGKKNAATASSKKQWSEESEFGITIKDVQHIAACFNNIADIAIVRDLRRGVPAKNGATEVKLFASTPAFLEVTHSVLKDNRGRWFSHVDMETKAHVCVLGTQAALRLFGLQDPVGKEVTIGEVGFKVIGTIENPQGRKIGDGWINDVALIPLDTANAAFGSRVMVASSTRWRKLYARVECDYLFIQVADLRQIDNTINRLQSYFQASHEIQDYEILKPQ
jgi:hypothetical protein